jgi:hypothetical protein
MTYGPANNQHSQRNVKLAEKSDLLPIFVPAFAAAPAETWRDRLDALRLILRDRGFTLEPEDLMALFFNALKNAPKDSRSALLAGARGLMDEMSHRELVARLEAEESMGGVHGVAQPAAGYCVGKSQRTLFD